MLAEEASDGLVIPDPPGPGVAPYPPLIPEDFVPPQRMEHGFCAAESGTFLTKDTSQLIGSHLFYLYSDDGYRGACQAAIDGTVDVLKETCVGIVRERDAEWSAATDQWWRRPEFLIPAAVILGVAAAAGGFYLGVQVSL